MVNNIDNLSESASGGAGAYLFPHEECPIRRYHIENSCDEIRRFEKARAEAKSQLEQLFLEAAETNEEAAEAFSEQIEVMNNDAIAEMVYDVITDEMINAEVAVALLCDKLIQSFAENECDVHRTYAIHSASELVIRILLGINI